MPKEKTTPVLVRFASALLDSVDSWRRIQKDLPTRPEAIRRLVEEALAKEKIRNKGDPHD